MYRRQPSSSFNLIQQRLHHSVPYDAIVNVTSNYHFNIVFFPPALDCHRSLSSHQPQPPPSDRYISTATPSASAPQHTQHPSPTIKPNIDLFLSSVCTSNHPAIPAIPTPQTQTHKHPRISGVPAATFHSTSAQPAKPSINRSAWLVPPVSKSIHTYIQEKGSQTLWCLPMYPSIHPILLLRWIKKKARSHV